MSASPVSSATASEPPTPGGFKSFWKKSSKAAQSQNLTFVQQDPSGARKGGLRRLWKGNSNPGSPETEGRSSTTSDAKKRRQQVYDAQRRHRNRKAEYIQSLEAEVAKLQHLDARTNDEKNALIRQNRAIRDFMSAQSLDAKLSLMDLALAPPQHETFTRQGSVAVNVRFDEDMQHERTFLDYDFNLDLDNMTWTASESTVGTVGTVESDRTYDSFVTERTERPPPHTPVKGDSYAALDFILALEWPCRDHLSHPFICPHPGGAPPAEPDGISGHSLMTTAAVLSSALPPPTVQAPPPGAPGRWQLPHSEIDKLVKLSQDLELDDELLTPAQAYSAIREHVPEGGALQPVLEALKKPLGSHMQCHGFGACMETQTFWQQLDTTLQALLPR